MASTADLVVQSVEVEDDKTFRQMNLREKISYIREVITVEPLIAAYIMASILCGPALANLEFEKSCRVNLNLNDTVCEAILNGEHENYTDQNNEIQILISDMHSWQQPMQSFMPLILVLFLGSYSDRHKWRKPFLLVPLIGELFAVAGCILCVVFMRTWSLDVQGVLQTVVPSFFGGQTMIVMATYAYIADVSTLEMRTIRVGVVQIVLNVCFPLVQSFSAVLFVEIGYYGVLLIAAGIYLFGIVYGIFWIKEPKQPIKESAEGLLCDIFNPQHAIDTFNLVLKKKPGTNRLIICLVMLTLFVYSGVVDGETSVFFLYTQGRFNWTIVEFSYFATVNTMVHLVGALIAVPLFTKVLKLKDITILLFTFFDKIIVNLLFGFANTELLLYVATAVSLTASVTGIAIRSIATKIVSEDDLGKAQSLFGICEALAPAVAIPIYNKAIYNNTLTTFPAAFFFLGIALYVFCTVVMLWMSRIDRRKNLETAKEENGMNGSAKEENGMNGSMKTSTPKNEFAETTHI